MAAWARDRAAGRQQLRCIGFPGDTGPAAPNLHHAPPARRGLVRANTAAPARDGWAAAHQGCTPAEARLYVLVDGSTCWQRMLVPAWYGERERVVEICSATAVWRHAGLPVLPIRWVLLRDPQRRFDPQALLCTDPARDPLQIVRWFIQRWQVEVTFREVRDHLGVETQRQWSDRAIARTTPCLLALFSIVTLLAARLDRRARSAVCIDAWHRKARPTFADTLAAVRRQFWREQGLLISARQPEVRKLRPGLRHGIAFALCQAP